jgi:hypothetical protein
VIVMNDYKWYSIVDAGEPIQQGDLISSCPIVVPLLEVKPEMKVRSRVIRYNVIVMSQSCDLVSKKIDLVLVCPYHSLDEIEDPRLKHPKEKERLRKGYFVGYHLLNKCDIGEFETDYLIVDFRNVYGVPFAYLDQSKERILRLLPPYREHLSQNFARFFMRVGLPVDIPSFV